MKAFPSVQFSHMEAEAGSDIPKPVYINHPGMDLRDYMAAHSLASIVHDFASPGIEDTGTWCNWVARVSYDVADAMMKAREANDDL